MNVFDSVKMRELSQTYTDAGWTLIDTFISPSSPEWKWLYEHNINVFRIPLRTELWFEDATDAVAFKLRWM